MAMDIFAKLGDIKGESTDDKHKDEVEVLSYSWGVTNPVHVGTGGGGGYRQSDVPGSFHRSQNRQGVPEAAGGVRDGCASEGSHHHVSEGRQRSAGLPHHKNE